MTSINNFFNELDIRIKNATNIIQLRNLKRRGRNFVNSLPNWTDRRYARRRYQRSLSLIRVQAKKLR